MLPSERGRQLLGEVDRPYVSWRNDVALFLGPRLTGYSAVSVEDLTAVEVARNIHSHPTLSEAVKEVVHGVEGHMINF